MIDADYSLAASALLEAPNRRILRQRNQGGTDAAN